MALGQRQPGAAGGGPGSDSLNRGSSWVLERAQDLLSVFGGVVLIALAGTLLVSGCVDFVNALTASRSVELAAENLLDRVLLVLILVEIVHTVVLSLRAHTLAPEPFIVVGLVAVIRKILLVLSNSQKLGTTQLALLLAMVAVFVGALVAVNRLRPPHRPGEEVGA